MGANYSEQEKQDFLRRYDEQTRQLKGDYEAKIKDLKEQTRQLKRGYEATIKELKERFDIQEHKMSTHRKKLEMSEEQWKEERWEHKRELKEMEEQWNAEKWKLKEQLKAKEEQKKEEELKHNIQLLYKEKKIENMEEQRKNMEEQIKRMEGEMQNDVYLKRIYRSRYKLIIRRPETYVKDNKSLNISLFGETGTGKTSLINSLKYAIYGTLSDTYIEQTAPEYFQGAHTMQRRKIALTEHLNVIDNRGVNAEHFRNPTFLNDVIRLMEGKKPREVTPLGNISTKEKSYCAVMVFSAHQKGLVMESRDFISKLFEWQGRFPLAVITHVDEESSQHVRLVLGSLGVGDIYDVANITQSRKELELTYQCSLLELLERCFIYGDEIYSYRRQ